MINHSQFFWLLIYDWFMAYNYKRPIKHNKKRWNSYIYIYAMYLRTDNQWCEFRAACSTRSAPPFGGLAQPVATQAWARVRVTSLVRSVPTIIALSFLHYVLIACLVGTLRTRENIVSLKRASSNRNMLSRPLGSRRQACIRRHGGMGTF